MRHVARRTRARQKKEQVVEVEGKETEQVIQVVLGNEEIVESWKARRQASADGDEFHSNDGHVGKDEASYRGDEYHSEYGDVSMDEASYDGDEYHSDCEYTGFGWSDCLRTDHPQCRSGYPIEWFGVHGGYVLLGFGV